MQLSDAKKGLRVRYGHGTSYSPYEKGVITSWNDTFIFVVFQIPYVSPWEVTSSSELTAKACYPSTLSVIEE